MSYKKTLLLLAYVSAIGSGSAHADTTQKDIIVNVQANIVAESCRQISLEGNDIIKVIIDDIPINKIQDIKRSNSTMSLDTKSQGAITFECASGNYANFSLSYNKADKCMSDNDSEYICGGKNKSVGFRPSFKWVDKDGNSKSSVLAIGNEKINTIKVDNKVAVLTLETIFLRTIRGVEPMPGNAEANFIVTVWEP